MDFEKILHVARKNELNKKEPVKCLQTKFKPPTKEQREKDKVLSEGVQRFLARKEEEERQRQREAERRKQELLSLRAKDPKASKRIQTMLKRTKSANKSVMEDAIDTNNTADTLAGPSQPDEDDYGFVSETSSQLYNKLIQKMYSSGSDDHLKYSPVKKPNSSNLLNTKERVKMALLKQEEEDKLPHKRKKKLPDKKDEEENLHLDYNAPDRDLEKVETSKVRKTGPPPIDFHELLKIAEQKQHEPIVFEPKEKKFEEPEVLMTKKQKLEHERMLEWKRKRELSLQNSENCNRSLKDEKVTSMKIPKLKDSAGSQKVPRHPTINHDDSRQNTKPKTDVKDKELKTNSVKDSGKMLDRTQKSKVQKERQSKLEKPDLEKKYKNINEETSRLIKERDEALKILKEKERLIKERDEVVRKLKEKEQLIKERDEAVRKLKLLEKAEKSVKSKAFTDNSLSSAEKSQKLKNGLNVKNHPPSTKLGMFSSDSKINPKSNSVKDRVILMKDSLKTGTKELSRNENVIRPKPCPPRNIKDTKCKVRQFPPSDLKLSRQFPPSNIQRKPPPMKKRRIIDSDEDEYDSELEDFIDDGEADVGPEDVSKVISEIFRYDKNRYSRYDDDNDECMESNFAQISKEEFFSTKCGILEDLQDIQKEKAALARKKKR